MIELEFKGHLLPTEGSRERQEEFRGGIYEDMAKMDTMWDNLLNRIVDFFIEDLSSEEDHLIYTWTISSKKDIQIQRTCFRCNDKKQTVSVVAVRDVKEKTDLYTSAAPEAGKVIGEVSTNICLLEEELPRYAFVDSDMDDEVNELKHMYCMQIDTRYVEQLKDTIKKYVAVPGEDVFMPMTERHRTKNGKSFDVLRPVFPGYLFITSNDSTGLFGRLRAAWGKTVFKFVQLLRNNEYVIPLTEGDERMITEYADEDYVIKKSRGYMVGDKLKIIDGALKDREGEVVQINRHKQTATINVEFLGSVRPITVGLEIVVKVPVEKNERSN